MSVAPESLEELIEGMTPEIHGNLKRAVELGRWENGDKLSTEQVELCLQAVIAYDAVKVPEKERVAYIDRSKLKTKMCGE
jgi:uncharacterized protein